MGRAIVAGASLATAFGDVANGGTGAIELAFSLRDYAGRDVETVIAAIVDALAPAGGPPDENEIREGMTAALAECLPDGAFNPDALDADMIGALLQAFLTEEVFRRMLAESGGALTVPGDAMASLGAEQDLRSIVKAQVDITAGPLLHNLNLGISRGKMEGLAREIIRSVWAEFEAYGQ